MIRYKTWVQEGRVNAWRIEGWYLFGFIPLYVRDLELRGRFRGGFF